MLNNSLFDAFTRNYESRREADMSIADYLALCKEDPMAYAMPPSGCWRQSANLRSSTQPRIRGAVGCS